MAVVQTLDTLVDGHDKIVERMDEHAADDRVRLERLEVQYAGLNQRMLAMIGIGSVVGGGVVSLIVNHFSK